MLTTLFYIELFEAQIFTKLNLTKFISFVFLFFLEGFYSIFSFSFSIYIIWLEFTELWSVGVLLILRRDTFLIMPEEQSVHVQNSISFMCPVILGRRHMDSISMCIWACNSNKNNSFFLLFIIKTEKNNILDLVIKNPSSL